MLYAFFCYLLSYITYIAIIDQLLEQKVGDQKIADSDLVPKLAMHYCVLGKTLDTYLPLGPSCLPINVVIQPNERLESRTKKKESLRWCGKTGAKCLVHMHTQPNCNTLSIFIIFRFAETYVKTLSYARWYGANVTEVFHKVKMPQYANDPYRAASEQFHGQGSYGNGSGMRVFPVALYYHNNCENIEMVS